MKEGSIVCCSVAEGGWVVCFYDGKKALGAVCICVLGVEALIVPGDNYSADKSTQNSRDSVQVVDSAGVIKSDQSL